MKSWNRLLYTLLLLVASLFLLSACEKDDDDDGDDAGDRGIILRDQSVLYGNTLHLQVNSVRPALLGAASGLSDVEVPSEEAAEILQSTGDNLADFTREVGVVDLDGTVLQSHPEGREGEQVEVIVAEGPLSWEPAISQVRMGEDQVRRFDYEIPILDNNNDLTGVVWVECIFDTLTRRSFGVQTTGDSLRWGLFMIEPDTRVVYEHRYVEEPNLLVSKGRTFPFTPDEELRRYFGAYLNNESTFPDLQVLADLMTNWAQGDTVYNSANAPGSSWTDGERVVGWSRIYVEQTYWVLAVTEKLQ